MPSGHFYIYSLDRSISYRRGVWLFFFLLLPYFVEIPVFNASNISSGQAPYDLGLHYLPMSLLWDARHKWVKFLLFLVSINRSLFIVWSYFRFQSTRHSVLSF